MLASRAFLRPRVVASGRIQRSQRAVLVRSSVDTAVSSAEVIASNDSTKLEELTKRFKMADVDGNGAIDRDELRFVLGSTDGGAAVMFTEHWVSEEELDRVMEQYDTNKDGVIDFNEFTNIVYDGLLLDGKLEEYQAAFNAADISGNGTVGATELAKLFAELGQPISYEKTVDIMQRYDRDESGQIEFGEFLMMFRDQLLDLRAVQAYMGTQEGLEGRSGTGLLEPTDGDIALIFSDKELDEAAARCQKEGKLLVVFSALTWCRPCKGMQRPSQRMAEAYKDSTVWVKLFGNANSNTKTLFKDRLKIRSTPCFMVFKNGEVVYTQTGTNKEKLEAGIRAEVPSEQVAGVQWIYPPAAEGPADS